MSNCACQSLTLGLRNAIWYFNWDLCVTVQRTQQTLVCCHTIPLDKGYCLLTEGYEPKYALGNTSNLFAPSQMEKRNHLDEISISLSSRKKINLSWNNHIFSYLFFSIQQTLHFFKVKYRWGWNSEAEVCYWSKRCTDLECYDSCLSSCLVCFHFITTQRPIKQWELLQWVLVL